MTEKIIELLPEIAFIKSDELRESVINCWVYALMNSNIPPDNLTSYTFPNEKNKNTEAFIQSKKKIIKLSLTIAEEINSYDESEEKINVDVLLTGALLFDIGKFVCSENKNNTIILNEVGKYVEYQYLSLSIADRYKLPSKVLHIIATHKNNDDLSRLTKESEILYHVLKMIATIDDL